MKSKAHKSIRRRKGEKVRGVRGQLRADGAAGLVERGGEERETDRGQDADRHHACSARTDAQVQKGAPQTSIPLGKSLQCPYCHDGQEPGPVNHGCLCQVRVRPRHAAALLDLTGDAQWVDVQSSVPPGRLHRGGRSIHRDTCLKVTSA